MVIFYLGRKLTAQPFTSLQWNCGAKISSVWINRSLLKMLYTCFVYLEKINHFFAKQIEIPLY